MNHCARVRLVHYPPGLRQAKHAHAHASLTLLLAGQLCEQVGRHEVVARVGLWCHKPVGVDHVTAFGPAGASTLQLSLPAPCVLPSGLAWQWGRGGGVSALLWALLRGSPPAVSDELLQDLSALLEAGDEDSRIPPWWPRAQAALCEGQAAVGEVAADCGVHRSQLVRVTQRLAGCTPVVLRQRARLGRSLGLMSREPMTPLCEVAAAGGFADQAHLNRACRRWLQLTPAQWRRQWAVPGDEMSGRTSSGW